MVINDQILIKNILDYEDYNEPLIYYPKYNTGIENILNKEDKINIYKELKKIKKMDSFNIFKLKYLNNYVIENIKKNLYNTDSYMFYVYYDTKEKNLINLNAKNLKKYFSKKVKNQIKVNDNNLYLKS